MKVFDVCLMSVDQLNDEFVKLKKEQFNLCFQKVIGQFEKVVCVNEVCKDIVCIKIIVV